MLTTIILLSVVDAAILGVILYSMRMPTSKVEGKPMAFNVGDRVNVSEMFRDAMPYKEEGYLIVAVNSYVDGLTGEVGQTCSLTETDPRDFAGQYLELVTPPE